MASKNNNAEKVAELKFNFNIKTLVVLLFIGFFFLSIYLSFKDVNKVFPEKSISQLISDIKGNRVKKVEVVGDKIIVQYKNDQVASVNKESQSSLIQTLKDSGVDPNKVTITVKDNQGNALVVNFLSNLIPAILMIAFFIFIFRQARGAQDSIFSFGQARTKKYSKEMSRITFANVAGVDEAKKELEEIVDFLKNPKKYSKLGARSPKGVILVGPAGTGKTLLAKAVAGESNVPFFSIAGSEFMEMLVGIGAARVRDLFTVAKKSAPSIIFIDEVDAIGRTRSVSAMPAHDEREQTLNQILVEMDGFAPNDQVIVIAATNRGDLLDPALLRPGRFDRRVMLDYPDLEGRKAILQIHARGKPFTEGVSWEKIAKRTVGFSGADIENMLNEAAISAARSNHKEISNDDLEEAATKVKLGPEKKRLQSDRDKKITAYHEAGHALVASVLPFADPVHKISIISRGRAAGYTLHLPLEDRKMQSKKEFLDDIAVSLGGYVVEKMMFDDVTTGPSNDLQVSTAIARDMVTKYGMSEKIGVLALESMGGRPMFGKGVEDKEYSEKISADIDFEVARIMDGAYKKAQEIVTVHRATLDAIARRLIEVETIEREEYESIIIAHGIQPKRKLDIEHQI